MRSFGHRSVIDKGQNMADTQVISQTQPMSLKRNVSFLFNARIISESKIRSVCR